MCNEIATCRIREQSQTELHACNHISNVYEKNTEREAQQHDECNVNKAVIRLCTSTHKKKGTQSANSGRHPEMQIIEEIKKIQPRTQSNIWKKNTEWMIRYFNTNYFILSIDNARDSLKLTTSLSYCIKTIIQNNLRSMNRKNHAS